MLGRTTTGKGVTPVTFTVATTLDELPETIAGRTVVVQRGERLHLRRSRR